jgi:hypothetical protein
MATIERISGIMWAFLAPKINTAGSVAKVNCTLISQKNVTPSTTGGKSPYEGLASSPRVSTALSESSLINPGLKGFNLKSLFNILSNAVKCRI